MTATQVLPRFEKYWPLPPWASKSTACVSLYDRLIEGTGGFFTTENIGQLLGWMTPLVIDIRKAPQTRSADARSIRDHLLNVRDIFRLNMTDLAHIFNVTRQAVYGWLEDVEPKPEARSLILRLSQAADRLAKASVERPDLYVRRPMFDGKSLVDFLKTGQNLDNAIATVEALARKETSVRKEAPTRRAGKPKRQLENLDALATPLLRDNA